MLFGRLCIRPTHLGRLIATTVVPLAGRIERRNQRKFRSLPNTPKKRAIRTQAVKIKLRRIGRKLGFLTFPDNDKRLKKPRGQWLFDLIWWDNRSGRKAVMLAVESEWNTGINEVLHDFEKLLGIKSPLKLMIYRVRPKTAAGVRKGISEYLREFRQHVNGERYLFCEFQPDWTCFCYMLRVRCSPSGRLKSVKFRTVFKT